MALPVVVVEEAIADKLVEALVRLMKALKLGPAHEKGSQLGPVVNEEHRKSIVAWIEKGVSEGAKLVLDGRSAEVPGYENGFYLGPISASLPRLGTHIHTSMLRSSTSFSSKRIAAADPLRDLAAAAFHRRRTVIT